MSGLCQLGMISTPDKIYDIKLLIDYNILTISSAVVPNAVLEMSEQFILFLFNPAREFSTQFARYNGKGMRFFFT
jgi:hypothetical protein